MELKAIREQIDQIDRELTRLFEERMRLAAEVAQYKRSNNLPIFDNTREQQVLRQCAEYLQDKSLQSKLQQFFRELMRLSRSHQEQLLTGISSADHYLSNIKQMIKPFAPKENPVVAYQGVAGSYSEQAAAAAFPAGTLVGCQSFEDVLKVLQDQKADYGVLPIENSSTGGIAEVYDLLRKYGTYIVGERKIKIDHNLLGVKGATLDSIKKVYSHNEGLAQCREFLARYKDWECVPYYNTAVSAKFVAEANNPAFGAIASSRAAKIYDLEILMPNINFNKHNYTRFILVSNTFEVSEEADKISIYLSLPHVSGSLSHILNYFSAAGLNLTKIESRPIYNKSWEYYFYIDFIGSIHDQNVIEVLGNIAEDASYMEVLGNYACARQEG